MEKFVFLTNYYMPLPGPTAMCMHQIAAELANQQNEVYVIAFEDNSNISEVDGVRVSHIAIPSYMKIKKKSSSRVTAYLDYFKQIFNKLIHIQNYPLRSNKLVQRYVAAVESLIDGYDGEFTLIASYTPLEAVVAGSLLKKKYGDRIKAIYYSADTVSNEKGNAGILSADYREKKGIEWEMKLFSIYDSVMIMECHTDHYHSDNFSKFFDKYKIVNFPLLKPMSNECCLEGNSTDGKVRMVYAGSLYRRFRNPSFLCDILLQLDSVDMEISFMGAGDCDDIMNEYQSKSKGKIVYLGMQSHNIAEQYLISADILLSIGNDESPMAPSKIYEYMATGKPIIHVYTYEKDPCLEPLRKYGNALLIKNNPNVDMDEVFRFVTNRKNVDFSTVAHLFETSTPGYSVEMIKA